MSTSKFFLSSVCKFLPYLASSKILLLAQLVLQRAAATAVAQQYCPASQESSISSHFIQAKGSNRSYLNNSAPLHSTHSPCAADLPLNLIIQDTDECWAQRSDEGFSQAEHWHTSKIIHCSQNTRFPCKIWAFKPQGAQADELVNILNTSFSQAAFKFEQDSRKVLHWKFQKSHLQLFPSLQFCPTQSPLGAAFFQTPDAKRCEQTKCLNSLGLHLILLV